MDIRWSWVRLRRTHWRTDCVFIASLLENTQIESGEYTQGIPHSSHTRATQGDIRVSIIVLLACVIKADGRILKSEINSIKPFLVRNFGEEGAKQALMLLKQLLKQDINPTEVAQQIRQHVNYSVRLELIHLLLEVMSFRLTISNLRLIRTRVTEK